MLSLFLNIQTMSKSSQLYLQDVLNLIIIYYIYCSPAFQVTLSFFHLHNCHSLVSDLVHFYPYIPFLQSNPNDHEQF